MVYYIGAFDSATRDYILAIFFLIIVRIVENLEQSLIFLIIDKICCGVVIAMIVNILINWARFVKNIYKDYYNIF